MSYVVCGNLVDAARCRMPALVASLIPYTYTHIYIGGMWHVAMRIGHAVCCLLFVVAFNWGL
jgi:hypothetical protein